MTGIIALLARTIHLAIKKLANSYIIALAVITILMILLIGKFRIGVLSMMPNLAPILMTLLVIGLTPLKMAMFNMLIVSIAIGLTVDNTIHFIHNFKGCYEQIGDVRRSGQ